MAISYAEARALLEAHGQSQVLRFWPTLPAAQQQELLAQIASLDFESVSRMRRLLAARHDAAGAGEIRPADVLSLSGRERDRAGRAGKRALRAGEVGVILVAGGQGTRLGFGGPKGLFPIGPITGRSLFEIQAKKILARERRFGAPLPLYVMTSESNDGPTRDFFAANGSFGLSPERVRFFSQGMWPALSAEGRIILDRPDHIFLGPDGHGGVLAALRNRGMLADMDRRGLRTLFYLQVDNPLVDVADPVFIGAHLLHDADLSLKVCAKRDPEEKLGVYVLRNGRPAVVEYTELSHRQKYAGAPDGRLRFRFGSVAIHVFALPFLRKEAEAELPLHIAHKKVPFCDDRGRPVRPDQPNAYKFERFVFDALSDAERVVALEFERREEFSPVKNASGEDSPETVRRDLTEKFASWLETCGAVVPRDAAGRSRHRIEIAPCFALSRDELGAKIGKGFRVTSDLLLGDQPASGAATTRKPIVS